MAYLIVIAIGYLLGCSNLAAFLAKRKGVDLSAKGSGNLGTSNAVILMGWRLGVLVGIHDIGKAVLAVAIAKLLFPNISGCAELAGTACVIGHIFPVFMKFRGGKGFASYIGMMLILNWKFALVVLLAVVVVTLAFDYLVVGTTLTVISLPAYMAITSAGWFPVLVVCIATGAIIFKHHTNYVRIWKGTEIGLRSALKGEHRVK